jgi:hypothetical protein
VVIVLAILLVASVAHAGEVTLPSEVAMRLRATLRSRTVVTLAAGETVDVIAERGRWIKIRARGRTGWISHESLIELDTPEPVEQEPAVVEEPVDVSSDVEVSAGLSVLTQGLRTAGSATSADNYNIGVTAATLAVSGRYTFRVRDDVVVGGELSYTHLASLPGIRHIDPQGGLATTTAFSVHTANARLVAGRVLERRRAILVFARAGVRFHHFRIGANPAMIPSELQLAPTLGAGIEGGRKLAVRLVLDTHALGVRTRQTPGRRDGVEANARGATLRTAIAYRWRSDLELRVAHELGIAAFDFGAPDPASARMHAGTSVARFDVVHALTIGIAKRF